MRTVLTQTVKNMQRHFVVWGLLATVIMYAGMTENRERSGHFERPPAVGTFEYVMQNNKCEDTVEGKFPTAVVLYNMNTGGYEFSTVEDHISKGLDEEFAGKVWKGYTVKYFCK
jgi:hypothetical protein